MAREGGQGKPEDYYYCITIHKKTLCRERPSSAKAGFFFGKAAKVVEEVARVDNPSCVLGKFEFS